MTLCNGTVSPSFAEPHCGTNAPPSTVSNMIEDLGQQMVFLQSVDVSQMQADRRQSSASSAWESSGPISPYSGLPDDSRRPSMARTPISRAAPSRSAATSPRNSRLASVSESNGLSALAGRQLPLQNPPPVPSFWAQQSQQQPSTTEGTSSPPFIPRRHTSTDIRENPGWRSAYSSSEHLPLPNASAVNHYSPFGSTSSLGQWPSLPGQQATQGEQQLRDTLGRYQIDSRNPSSASDATVTQTSYPTSTSGMNQDMSQTSAGFLHPVQNNMFAHVEGASLFNSQQPHRGSMFNKDIWATNSGGSTRRSSMAHILNPADTAERDEEEDLAPDERQKRQRMS